MPNEKFAQLKRQCAQFLSVNGIKPATKAGRTATHTFWHGALSAMEDNEARAVILLATGRYGDLLDFTPENL